MSKEAESRFEEFKVRSIPEISDDDFISLRDLAEQFTERNGLTELRFLVPEYENNLRLSWEQGNVSLNYREESSPSPFFRDSFPGFSTCNRDKFALRIYSLEGFLHDEHVYLSAKIKYTSISERKKTRTNFPCGGREIETWKRKKPVKIEERIDHNRDYWFVTEPREE